MKTKDKEYIIKVLKTLAVVDAVIILLAVLFNAFVGGGEGWLITTALWGSLAVDILVLLCVGITILL